MAKNLSAEQSRSIDAKINGKNANRSIDNGGRRLGIERRQFTYSYYVPERRIGIDRRMNPERSVDEKQSS
jgi:hypothetical protein